MFLGYASSRGHALIDRELYLPKSWTGDRDRCRAAAVPDEVEFATKARQAQVMLGRALDGGVPASWVTADEAYGKNYKFRSWLEARRVGYVVAVACNQVIPDTRHLPRRRARRARPEGGVEAPQLRGGRQGPAPV